MPTQSANSQIVMLIGLTLGVGVLSVIVVWLLMLAWRRHERRQNTKPDDQAQRSDLWQAAGDRLSAKLNQQWSTERHGRLEEDDPPTEDLFTDDYDSWDEDPEDDDDDDDEFAGR